MPYTPTNWADDPSTVTPLDAANLNKLEQAVKGGTDLAQSASDTANGNNAYADAKTLVGVRATQSADVTALIGQHNPIDATSAARAVTLPTATGNAGARTTIERIDTTTNHTSQFTVTITGPIRSTTTSSFKLSLANESVEFLSDGAGAWWPISGHKPLRSLDQHYGLPAYAPAGLLNRYDPVHNVYNWKRSNTRRCAAGLGRAMRGGLSQHLIISDSGGAGVIDGVSTPFVTDRPNAWPLQMRDELARHGIPTAGSGIYRFIDGALIPSYLAFTGTWVGGNAYTSSATAGSTITLTVDKAGTTVTVEYFDTGTGTFTVSVNGASSGAGFTTVTQANTAVWKKVTLTGLAVTAGGTVTITKTGTGTSIFTGAWVWTPNSGIQVHNASQSGAKASGTGTQSWGDFTSSGLGYQYLRTGGLRRTITDAQLTNASTTLTSSSANFSLDDVGKPLDFLVANGKLFPQNTYIAAYISATQVTMSNPAVVSGTGGTVYIGRDPDVVHISLGGNDHPVLASPGAGQTLISTVITAITAIRNQFPNSDCVLYIEQALSQSLITDANWEAFAGQMYLLADALDVPLFDMRDRFGNFATASANGLMGDNQAHLQSGAYADWGRNVAQVMAA